MKEIRKKKTKVWGIKNKNGILQTSKEDILNRWAEFYEELYYQHHSDPPRYVDEEPIPPILMSELEFALRKLKKEKAPGPDGINPKLDGLFGEN